MAAVYHGPNDLRLEERPVPTIGPGEVLLKTVGCGICATDLRILHGDHGKFPTGTIRIPGHELVGDIVEVGANATGVEASQRVFVAPNMGCGHCRQCVTGNNNRCARFEALGITMDGAFAEYVRIPAAAVLQGNLIPLKSETDPSVAPLIEPFACVLRGQRVLDVQPDDVMLVVGAGPIGLMHVLLARLRGVGRILVADLNNERLTKAKEAGANRVIDCIEEQLGDVVLEESNGQGADVIVIAAASHEAQEEALSLAAIGGRISFFGGLPKDRSTVRFDSNLLHYKELRVTGTTACSTSDCWEAASIVNSGRIDLASIVTNRFPLGHALEAFAAAEQQRSLKIVLEA
ncbi:MAG: alcohol dehydrogenase catalytic domain-containing protein [Alphaproteobacteria bacterium]